MTERIGVIADVHANLFAFRLVLEALEREGCGEILCCGDLVDMGPWPEETVRLAMSLPHFRCVRGNHDDYALIAPAGPPYPHGVKGEEAVHYRWTREQLSSESLDYLASLPHRLFLERQGVTMELIHYPSDEGNAWMPVVELDRQACARLLGTQRDVVLFGHDHRPFHLEEGRRLYRNPGSLGCPHEERDSSGSALARCGVLTVGDGKADYHPLAIPYDVGKVTGRIRELGFPAAETVARIFFGG